MKKYNLSIFKINMDNLSKEIENKEKKEGIGKIISSLQKPFQDVIASIMTQGRDDYLDEVMRILKR